MSSTGGQSPFREVCVSPLQRKLWVPAVSVDSRRDWANTWKRDLLRGAKQTNRTRLRRLPELKNLNSWETTGRNVTRYVYLPHPSFSQDISLWQLFCIPILWPILEIRDWTGRTLGLRRGTSVGQSDATTGQGAGRLTGTAFHLCRR